MIANAGILGAFGALILSGHLLVQPLVETGRIKIPYPPLDGRLDWRPARQLVFAAIIAGVVAVWGPRWARRLSWRHLLMASVVAAGLWAVALAALDGTAGLVGSVRLRTEYWGAATVIDAPFSYLHGFVANIRAYPVHVQGHPPGYVLLLWALHQLGVTAAGVATTQILGGAFGVAAVLVAVREVAGEDRARDAAPFLVLAPVAIWVATSADAFYAGVSGWAVALVILATGNVGRRADLYAVVGGVLLGIAFFFSYGLVLIALIPFCVAWRRRRFRPIVIAALAVAGVAVVFAASGFWWFSGLMATRERYFAGVASRRPYPRFFVMNLAAFAITLGPAQAVALVRLRDRGLWTLVGGALLVVVVANISGMSKGEVERIWLPFALWVLPAGAVLATRLGTAAEALRATPVWSNTTRWLLLQGVFTIVVQAMVWSPW